MLNCGIISAANKQSFRRLRDKMILITKELTFDAAHHLPWHQGECRHLHGHTYRLQVSVTGELNENGVLIDFKNLKTIMQKTVIELFDHKYINDIISNPTTENMAVHIFNLLQRALAANDTNKNIKLFSVKLWETPTSFAEVTKYPPNIIG